MPCAPGMARCKIGCLHRQFVDGYREERRRQEDAAIEAANGYATELAEYLEQNPLPTFHDWLIHSRRAPAAERNVA